MATFPKAHDPWAPDGEPQGESRQPAGDNLVPMRSSPVVLPDDVSAADWAEERDRVQNPRIRAFLRAIRLLEAVRDSNYAILHCSPYRLEQVWRQVGRVAELIRNDIKPSLEGDSRIPALEMARRRAEIALNITATTVLAELDRFPAKLAADQMLAVRKLLCVSTGKLHAFLQDTFCQIMAADPRSRHDADYYLSKRFPRDIEEAEWLHTTVERLESYLDRIGRGRFRRLVSLESMLARERALPDSGLWQEVLVLLEEFQNVLTPLIKEVLSLRGIRFDEMEALDRYAFEIPAKCQMLSELYRTAQQVTDEIMLRALEDGGGTSRAVRELTTSHAVLARRMAELLRDLNQTFQDLMAFVPLWVDNIELRRALLLRRDTRRR